MSGAGSVFWSALIIAGGWVASGSAGGALKTAVPEFNRDVRPILAEHCFKCHGADEKARKGKLRLDLREDAVAKKAIMPGDAERSGLVQRIYTKDADDVMPPPEAHETLTDAQREILKRWVQSGAGFQKHWAFIPPLPPTVPAVADGQGRAMGPVDAFVLAALRERGFQPAPPAPKEQWLRRVTFALTGLPPKLEDLDAFLADASPSAREKVVDRLLNSPAYGEHVAEDWLDAARYADSYGRHEDGDMVAWPWRDWVIRAFNSNLPYDQFITWQTAGDLLPQPTRDQLVATAFNRLSPQSNESGNDPVEFRLDQVSDRVRTNGLAFMGLSLECAKCHDHKYDPVSQKEYWQVAAMFDNIEENGVYSQFCPKAVPSPSILLPTEDQRCRLEALRSHIADTEQEMERVELRLRPEFDQWISANGVPGGPREGWWNAVKGWFGKEERVPWKRQAKGWFDFGVVTKKSQPLVNRANKKKPGQLRTKLPLVPGPVGNAMLLKGDDEITFPGLGEYHRYLPFSFAVWLKPGEHRERAVVIAWSRGGNDDGRGYEVLLQNEVPEFALMHFHPGSEIRIRAKTALPLNQWTHLAVSYDGSSRASGLRMWLNGLPAGAEVVRDHLHKDIDRRKEWGDIDRADVHFTLGGRFHDHPLKNCAVDEFHVFDRFLSDGEAKHLAGLPTVGADWFEWWLQTRCNDWKKLAHQAMLLRKKETETAGESLEMMIMQERGERRPGFVRVRGDFRQPGEAVEPGVPQELMPLGGDLPRNRLGFARWLTDPRHPLTSRVVVNRLWQLVFGRGIVGTPQDFGTRGELPTHPELLDWLACDFMRHGWDVKRLMRQMVLSEAFSRSAAPADPRLLVDDPENRWLARGPRTRLAAEEVRDLALVASGLLTDRVGGPSLHGYVPPGFSNDSGLQQRCDMDEGESLYRRSLYSFWRRTLPPPELAAFDAPSREFCVVKREGTTSPAQALMLLNQTQFVEAQRVLAEQIVRETGDLSTRCEHAFRLLTSRRPTVEELGVLVRLVGRQREFFEKNVETARALLGGNGQAPVDAALPPAEVAATTMMVRALMSHDEALNR